MTEGSVMSQQFNLFVNLSFCSTSFYPYMLIDESA